MLFSPWLFFFFVAIVLIISVTPERLDLFEEAKASEGAVMREISYLSWKDRVMNYKPSKILKSLNYLSSILSFFPHMPLCSLEHIKSDSI
jgi:hypothetical protein